MSGDGCPQRIGIPPDARGIVVRGVNHLTECVVAGWPDDFPDEDCTCLDSYSE